MKKLLTLTGAALIAAGAFAAPDVKWLEEVHDFGAFDENDGKVTCVFKYVNTGDEPLTVVAARATCGCTTPEYTAAPVEPGDTGIVAVTYNPTGRPGRFSKKVYIDFNIDPPRSTLMIKGVVIGSSNTLRSRYPEEAGALKMRTGAIMFGKMRKGGSKTVFHEVYNSSNDTLVPRWDNLPPYLHLRSAVDSIPPGEQTSYSFFFVTNETDTYGIITDTITLTPDPDEGTSYNVDIVGVVEQDFRGLSDEQKANAPVIATDTESVDFDVIARDSKPQSKTFTVTNNGKRDMLIRRAYSADKGVSVSTGDTTVKPGKSTVVTVTVDPSQVEGDILDARVTVIANDPASPNTVVRAVGQIR